MDKQEQLVDAILESAINKRDSDDRKQITCAEAFELANRFEVEVIEIGQICNQHEIKIRKCQLGCFV